MRTTRRKERRVYKKTEAILAKRFAILQKARSTLGPQNPETIRQEIAYLRNRQRAESVRLHRIANIAERALKTKKFTKKKLENLIRTADETLEFMRVINKMIYEAKTKPLPQSELKHRALLEKEYKATKAKFDGWAKLKEKALATFGADSKELLLTNLEILRAHNNFLDAKFRLMVHVLGGFDQTVFRQDLAREVKEVEKDHQINEIAISQLQKRINPKNQ